MTIVPIVFQKQESQLSTHSGARQKWLESWLSVKDQQDNTPHRVSELLAKGTGFSELRAKYRVRGREW